MLGTNRLAGHIALCVAMCITFQMAWLTVAARHSAKMHLTSTVWTAPLRTSRPTAQARKPHVKATYSNIQTTHTSKRIVRGTHDVADVSAAKIPRTAERRIEALVLLHQPKRGKPYARRVARIVCKYAHEHHVNPYWVATTICVESEFSMRAQPQIGVMQITPETAFQIYRHSGRDVYTLDGNVWMGASELGRHYRTKLASRGADYSLRWAWGRYNGSGPRGCYVKRCLRVLRRIEYTEPTDWKRFIGNYGSMWGLHKHR